jgi:hypothetical protein
MKITALVLSLIGAASAFAPVAQVETRTSLNAAKEELTALAEDLNPLVKFYDPLSLADADFWEQGNESTVAFLRHAEMKHGRVAMAAFVGYCVQSNYHWPWKMTLEGDDFPSIDLSPEQQWDAIPEAAKWQIISVVGFFELWSEWPDGDFKHYMRGGRPGVYPTFESFGKLVHPVPFNLYDPFNLNKNKSDEKKARGLQIEINNGRLAMLGFFAFLSADTIPGSVPLLKDIATPYDGSVMAPFAANFHVFN